MKKYIILFFLVCLPFFASSNEEGQGSFSKFSNFIIKSLSIYETEELKSPKAESTVEYHAVKEIEDIYLDGYLGFLATLDDDSQWYMSCQIYRFEMKLDKLKEGQTVGIKQVSEERYSMIITTSRGVEKSLLFKPISSNYYKLVRWY